MASTPATLTVAPLTTMTPLLTPLVPVLPARTSAWVAIVLPATSIRRSHLQDGDTVLRQLEAEHTGVRSRNGLRVILDDAATDRVSRVHRCGDVSQVANSSATDAIELDVHGSAARAVVVGNLGHVRARIVVATSDEESRAELALSDCYGQVLGD